MVKLCEQKLIVFKNEKDGVITFSTSVEGQDKDKAKVYASVPVSTSKELKEQLLSRFVDNVKYIIVDVTDGWLTSDVFVGKDGKERTIIKILILKVK